MNVCVYGVDCLDAELRAQGDARENGAVYISPYNAIDVIAGQATIGDELLEDTLQMKGSKTVYVTVGGGGLCAGVGARLREAGWSVVACVPERSACMLERLLGEEVVVGDTISDGSAGDIEDDSVTIELCVYVVERWVVVSEGDIKKAMKSVWDATGERMEGAAGCAVAGWMCDSERGDGVCVVIVCGGNIEEALFTEAVS